MLDLSIKELESLGKNKLSKKKESVYDSTMQPSSNTIEKHYCFKCYIDQPIRTKHCHSCRACIATFDHHCFWLGNCIGEKNRPAFMLYLFIQAGEMIVLITKPASAILRTGILACAVGHPLLLVTVVIYILLWLGLLSLMAYHVYFMLANLTTWEYISWNEITYLDGFDQKDGSAFSVSMASNICIYFRPHTSAFYDWVPTKPRK